LADTADTFKQLQAEFAGTPPAAAAEDWKTT
jgi:hypothetical protein